MMKKILLIIGLVVLSSCASKKEKLTFSKFIISDVSGHTEIKVEENGTIYIGENLIGVIDKEGMISTKNGTVLAEVFEDNVILDGDGKMLVSIDKKGSVENSDGEFITWSNDGELLKNDEPLGLSIFPADENSYQTASLLLYLHLAIK